MALCILILEKLGSRLVKQYDYRRPKLNFVDKVTYLGHVIFNDLLDDTKAKARLMFAKSNMIRQCFHFCSAPVKSRQAVTVFSAI